MNTGFRDEKKDVTKILPNDPYMLLSVVNTKLRDQYPSLADLCEDLDLNETELCERLSTAGFQYDAEKNQFR